MFDIIIGTTTKKLPFGLHSFSFGVYKKYVLLVGGRLNGLHGFSSTDPNFSYVYQNISLVVLKLSSSLKTWTFTLKDEDKKETGIDQRLIELIGVSNAQFTTKNNTLYVIGGYGFSSVEKKCTTKPWIVAYNLPQIIKYVRNPKKRKTTPLRWWIRFSESKLYQITGGALFYLKPKNLFALVGGQNFDGEYLHDGSSQQYSNSVVFFEIVDGGMILLAKQDQKWVDEKKLHRRDFNAFLFGDQIFLLSGVFSPDDSVWTSSVAIQKNKITEQTQFNQKMNHYSCANVGFSIGSKQYMCLFGGISKGYVNNENKYIQDEDLPFINQSSVVIVNKKKWKQYYLPHANFPLIDAFYGNNAAFIPKKKQKKKKRKKKELIGFIMGGIASLFPNTTKITDTYASDRIFPVYFISGTNNHKIQL